MAVKLSKNVSASDKNILPKLHPFLRIINGWNTLGGGIPFLKSDCSLHELIAQAEHRTSLSDWGDDLSFLVPLEKLTQFSDSRMQVTSFGKYIIRNFLLERLTNRLLIQKELNDTPEIDRRPTPRPILITGLPRTGTTFLQRLLSLDKASLQLKQCFAQIPAPAPTPSKMAEDPRVKVVGKQLKWLYRMAPELAAMHHSDPLTPDECLPLLMNSFMTDTYSLFTDFRNHHEWLDGQDMSGAYHYYKKQIQILQWKFPAGYFVLKSPAHYPYLESFLEEFPDAAVIIMHRTPTEAVPSLLNLRFKTLGVFNNIQEQYIPQLIEESLESLRYMRSKADACRRTRNANTFYDLEYTNLMRDPIGEVRRIYDYFNYEWDNALPARINTWLKHNPANMHGRHRYSLGQFNLQAEQISDLR